MDLSIQTLQIKELVPTLPHFEIFNKIVSCPINDFQAIEDSNPEETEFYKKALGQEQQLQVQVFVKTKEKLETSTQLKIEKKKVDVACVINRTRIIYNISTVINLLSINKEVSILLAGQMREAQIQES